MLSEESPALEWCIRGNYSSLHSSLGFSDSCHGKEKVENVNPKGGGNLGVCEGEREEWNCSKTSKREHLLKTMDLRVNVPGFGVLSPGVQALAGLWCQGRAEATGGSLRAFPTIAEPKRASRKPFPCHGILPGVQTPPKAQL